MTQPKFLFCNIGWMERYNGLNRKTDKIIGGGKHVVENKHGHEVCNFMNCPDSYVYGHVETIRGKTDRTIHIEELGASIKDEIIKGVTVVWTATHPETGGRYIVGWYRNADVFRHRQTFSNFPTSQHEQDKIDTFRIKAHTKDVVLLSVKKRDLALKRGKGWMGHTQWWFPHNHTDEDKSIEPFIYQVDNLINGIEGDTEEIIKVINSKNLSRTEKDTLVNARIGQGKFRDSLIREWNTCAVLECDAPELLRASHIKPWKVSNNKERLDHNNGLLLLASLDAAFDRGLISFKKSGKILISPHLTTNDRRILGITKHTSLRKQPSKSRQKYLKYHRTNIFQV